MRIPDGVDDVAGRKRLLTEFGIEIGGGLGEFKGKAWRIGLMGHNSRPNCVFQVLAALEQVLRGAGVKVEPRRGRRRGGTGIYGRLGLSPRGKFSPIRTVDRRRTGEVSASFVALLSRRV